MTDHRSRTRAARLRRTAVLIPRVLLFGLALLAPALDAGAQSGAQSIGVAIGRTVLDERVSALSLIHI